MIDFHDKLAQLRKEAEANDEVITEIISDAEAEECVRAGQPYVYYRGWSKHAIKEAFYEVVINNPTNVNHTFVHLTVAITPGWASNKTEGQINTALAARDPNTPTYTGEDVILKANSDTRIRVEFPVPSSSPVDYKFVGLGLLWGTHPSPELHYYDIGRFYVMRKK